MFFGVLPRTYANSCSFSFVQMRRQLKNSSPALCFLCLLVILQPKVTKTEKCPGSQEKSQDSIVDISLDPKRSVRSLLSKISLNLEN